jgi:hypothetical protein
MTREIAQASEALIAWFKSQGLKPKECLGVMAMTTGAIIAAFPNHAEVKDNFNKVVQAVIDY